MKVKDNLEEVRDNDKKETLSGTVERISYKNADNGFVIMQISPPADDGAVAPSVCALGTLGNISEGERLRLVGKYVISPKFGRQFKADACERVLPTEPRDIAKNLCGIIKALRPADARKIAEKYGAKTYDVLRKTPSRLIDDFGFATDLVKAVADEYRRSAGINDVTSFLQKYNISPAVGYMLWKKYEGRSLEEVRKNPYILCDISGDVEFSSADVIADEIGLKHNNTERIITAIKYSLRGELSHGHTCVPVKSLKENIGNFLEIGGDDFEINFYDAVDGGRLCAFEKKGGDYAFLKEYFTAEVYIARKISQMLLINYGSEKDYTAEIDAIEKEVGLTYDEYQRETIGKCIGNNVFILTGGPGTGKTTTLNAVIKLLKKQHKSLSLAAPTGRAAKRMSDLTGENAMTIHRLLEVTVTEDNSMTFRRNEENPVTAEVVIIDEMSMVDTLLCEALLRALKISTKLIMVGDYNQLPSVGAGNVLHDLIESEYVPSVELHKIFRQAAESLIVTNAHRIVNGDLPNLYSRASSTAADKTTDSEANDKTADSEANDRTADGEANDRTADGEAADKTADKTATDTSAADKQRDTRDFFFMPQSNSAAAADLICKLAAARLPKAYKLDPIDDIQILTPTRIGMSGTKELNTILQSVLNPPSPKKREKRFFADSDIYRVGDKVMQTRNNYNIEWKKAGESGIGIYNGDIGRVTDVSGDGIMINFDGRVAVYTRELAREIELAYAVTIHKSQGSEYDAVIIPVLPGCPERLLYRNLLYTAVTRAKRLLIIVGSSGLIEVMVGNDRKAYRYSCLKEFMEIENERGREHKIKKVSI